MPESYCSGWYLTLFGNFFKIDATVRVWDIILTEKITGLIKLALAVIKINEKQLEKGDLADVLCLLREFPEKCDIEQVIKVAFSEFDFTHAEILEQVHLYRKEYT